MYCATVSSVEVLLVEINYINKQHQKRLLLTQVFFKEIQNFRILSPKYESSNFFHVFRLLSFLKIFKN
jgi:hypothetical protein